MAGRGADAAFAAGAERIGVQQPVADVRDGQLPARAILEAEFDRLYGLVLRYLTHRFFDAELAEELTAQTLFKAAAAIHRVGGERRQVQAWLLRIATNVANSHHRHRRLRQLFLRRLARHRPIVAEAEAAHEPKDGTEPERVRAALLALRPKHQAVVVLRYYAQLSHEEIAEVLGCRPEAARARLSRALQEFRERLGPSLIDDQQDA
jgi:RNA polymerase sigma factor (sigma-70 family)